MMVQLRGRRTEYVPQKIAERPAGGGPFAIGPNGMFAISLVKGQDLVSVLDRAAYYPKRLPSKPYPMLVGTCERSVPSLLGVGGGTYFLCLRYQS